MAAGLLFAVRVYSSVSSPSIAESDLQTGSTFVSWLRRPQGDSAPRSGTNEAEPTEADPDDAEPTKASFALQAQRGVMAAVLPAAQSTMDAQPDSAAIDSVADLAVVDLSDRRVTVYRTDRVLADYPIAVGREHWETPVGEFQVIEKQENPIWRHPFTRELVPPGEDNPLGTNWIGFWNNNTHEIGFHGTNQAEAIGQAISHGCIRMKNSDIQALYAALPLGATVRVQP